MSQHHIASAQPVSRTALLGAWDLTSITWHDDRVDSAARGLLLHLVDGTFSLHLSSSGLDGHYAEHGVFVVPSPGRLDHRIENSTWAPGHEPVRRYRSLSCGSRLTLEPYGASPDWIQAGWVQSVWTR